MGARRGSSAAFDRIDHARLLAHLGTFPGRGMIAGWLAVGVIEQGRFAPTEEGTPQGRVVSPLLLNIALHGMEEAAGVRYLLCDPYVANVAEGAPVLVRYADGAGASHGLIEWLSEVNTKRGRTVEYSVGFAVTDKVRTAIAKVPAKAWAPAADPGGEARDNGDAVEITGMLNLSTWPEGYGS